MNKLMLTMMMVVSGVAMADDKRPEPSSEMKAAFEACKASGKPGDSAFDSCMSSKGFKKPNHDHKGGPSKREMPEGLKEAMDACKSKGKPGDASFESCMSSKGFSKPE